MTYTEKHHLPQWEEDDLLRMSDFNEAMASIESGINAAQASAGTTSDKGRLQITTGNYSGTGTAGSTAACKVTVSFKPMVLAVAARGNSQYGGCVWFRGMTSGQSKLAGDGSSIVALEWLDNGVKWYSSSSDVLSQLNNTGTTYDYLVIGLEE